MTAFPDLALLIPSLFVGWVIGANDAANSMGTAVGARVRTLREAVLLVGIFGFLGAVFFGGRVTRTLGERVLPLPSLPDDLGRILAFTAMIAGGLTVLICTGFGVPVSTSHAIVGGLIGTGIAAGIHQLIVWRLVIVIFIAWVLTPVFAGLSSIMIRFGIDFIWPKIRRYRSGERIFSLLFSERVARVLLMLTGCYMAFNWGANDVANAIGVLSGVSRLSLSKVTFLGGLAMSSGALTWGRRVMLTVGEKITPLTPRDALLAELAAALTVNVFTLVGMPVSTTHAIVGAISGLGLGKGRGYLNLPILVGILLTWTLTPFFAGSLAFLLFWLFKVLALLL